MEVKTKAFIIMFNRLTWPKTMAEYLSDTGCEVILIDNASTYKPLLQWYEKCPYKVHRMQENRWSSVFYECIASQYSDNNYILTDSDLDISSVPKDYLEVLYNGLSLFKECCKCGFSLRIDNLPQNGYTKKVIEHEQMFWINPANESYYHADIATTFALHDRQRMFEKNLNSIRCASPYTATHLPWYLTKESIESSEEEMHFLKESTWYGWPQVAKEIFKINPENE